MIRLTQTETYRKWERGLKDRKARALIAARLFRLANGLAGNVAPIGGGLSELRTLCPGYRVYFQRRGEEIVVLLCGGDKRTQLRDMEKAKRLAAEWKS